VTRRRGGRGGSRPVSSRRRGGSARDRGRPRPAERGGADLRGSRAPRRARRPAQLAAAAGLVAVEGLVAVAYAVYLAVLAVVGDPAESVLGVGLGALLVLLLGAGLVAAARALWAGRGGPRGIVTTVQLLALLTAVSTMPGASAGWVVGDLVAVGLAVGVLVLLFSAPAREALG
jgi:hypothetical protein